MDDKDVTGLEPHTPRICLYHYGLCQRVEAIKESIRVAKEEMNRRLEGMNEFRAQLDKQVLLFITRQELAAVIDKLELRIEQVETLGQDNRHALRKREGAAGPWQYIATVVVAAVVSLILSFVTRGQ